MSTVVVTRSLPEEGLAALRAVHDVQVRDVGVGMRMDEERLIEAIGEAEGLLSALTDPVTARVLDACPRLRVVAQYAVGYDNIDVAAAAARGVVVTHTPGVLTDATADFTLALLLGLARRVVEADRYVRAGQFARWETMALLGMELRGKVLGIVGMGRIGLAVARRAEAFGMRILYHNRRPTNPTDERVLGARYVDFDTLLAESDVISLHCPLNDASRGLFDAAAFRAMKPSALLVNTARGPVVDEAALVGALAAGEIAGAALDVFEREPEVHPGLLDRDDVILAPHLGSATVDARTAMARMCAESLLAGLAGEAKVPWRVG